MLLIGQTSSWGCCQVGQAHSISVQLPTPFEDFHDYFTSEVAHVCLRKSNGKAVHAVSGKGHCKYSTITRIVLSRDVRLFNYRPKKWVAPTKIAVALGQPAHLQKTLGLNVSNGHRR